MTERADSPDRTELPAGAVAATSADTAEGGKQGPGLIAKLIAKALHLRITRAYLRYSENHGPNLADSITYRALFSVFAAVLLGFSLAALWLGGNPDAMSALMQSLDRFIPGIGGLIDTDKIEAPAGFTVAGIAALVGLVLAAISAIASLRTALLTLSDQVYDSTVLVRAYVRNILVALGFGGLLLLAAALSVLASIGVDAVTSWFGISLGAAGSVVTRVIGIAVVLLIDTLAVALVFRTLSGVKAPRKALWQGALLGGVGLTILQELSGLFVRGATSNPLLATFAALIALLLWFNLSAQVILIASSFIIVSADESHDRIRERYGASSLAQRRRLRAEDRVRVAVAELRSAQEAEQAELEKAAA